MRHTAASILRQPRRADMRPAMRQGVASRADVEEWRTLLDMDQTSERDFLELFDIKTDVVADDESDAPVDPWVPFKWRLVQAKEHELIEEMAEAGRPPRIRIPKSRGHGVSSWNIALFGFCRVLRIPGYETKVIAQDQEESEEHLARLNDFYDQVNWAALKELGIERIRATKKSIVIQFGDMRRSKVRVMTARKQGLGRGGGSDAIITTERPHWPEKAKQDLTGLLSRLSRSRWSAHIDESTANGLDEYFRDCMRAQDKKGGYRLLFLPAYERGNNYLPPQQYDAAKVRSTCGTLPEYGAEEENDKRRMVLAYWKGLGLSDEDAEEKTISFLAWRRNAIEGECGGSISYLHREHPCTLEEAFQGTGRPVFDLDRLSTWAKAAQERQESGVLHAIEAKDKGVVAQVNPAGLWRIYEMPEKDGWYCFGADVSKGYEVLSDGKHEADKTVVNVKEVYSGRTVAKLRGYIFPHDLAWEIVKAAHFYNNARGLPEVNNDGGTVVAFIDRMEELVWGDHGADYLLTTERKVRTSTGIEKRKQLGWVTSGGVGGSKPYMIGIIQKFHEEVGRFRDGAVAPFDHDTLREAMLFAYTTNGRTEAQEGHDDCVIAEGLALVARQMLFQDEEVPLKSPVVKKEYVSEPRAALIAQDARLAKKEGSHGAGYWRGF